MEEKIYLTEQKNNSGTVASYFAKGREGFIKKLIYRYVNWERMWYDPKIKFIIGDTVIPNWKAKSFFPNCKNTWGRMTVKKIDRDNVVTMTNGELYNAYWLKRA